MEKEENTVTITATPNGPFIVEGRFKLVDREGKAEMKENRTAAADAPTSNLFVTARTAKSIIMIYP